MRHNRQLEAPPNMRDTHTHLPDRRDGEDGGRGGIKQVTDYPTISTARQGPFMCPRPEPVHSPGYTSSKARLE